MNRKVIKVFIVLAYIKYDQPDIYENVYNDTSNSNEKYKK